MQMYSIDRKIEKTDVEIHCVHPGFVKTDLFRRNAIVDCKFKCLRCCLSCLCKQFKHIQCIIILVNKIFILEMEIIKNHGQKYHDRYIRKVLQLYRSLTIAAKYGAHARKIDRRVQVNLYL